MTGFDREKRFIVSYHRFLYRTLPSVDEAWGMGINECYLVLVNAERFLLAKFSVAVEEIKMSKDQVDDADIALVWSCPLSAVLEVSSSHSYRMTFSNIVEGLHGCTRRPDSTDELPRAVCWRLV